MTFVKGAPEKILERCTTYLDMEGNVSKFTDRKAMTAYIDTQAARSMRMLAVALADGDF